MARPKGYLTHYRPQKATLELLEQVREVLVEYQRHLPMTMRQVFYRLVGKAGYEKTERAYSKLCDHAVNWRRAGLLAFEDIRDDGVLGGPPSAHYGSEADFWDAVRSTADRLVLDVLATQEVYLEVLCEAAGMLPQLQRVATPYSVSVYSSGGFDSLTAKREQAERVIHADKPAVFLHVGDYDPSGMSIFDALEEDVTAFLSVDAPELPVTFERVALTESQVRSYSLPTAPPKASDSRSKGWTETCQLEALPPDTLASLLDQSIRGHLDMELVAQRNAEAAVLRRELAQVVTDEMMFRGTDRPGNVS